MGTEGLVMKLYTVYDRKTGKQLARGSSRQCAAALGVTYQTFLTLSCRSAKGMTPYRVEIADNRDSGNRQAVAQWNRRIHLPAMARKILPYPCNDCAHRSLCEAMDSACRLWRQWYASAYNHAARRLDLSAGTGGHEEDGHGPG